MLSKVVLASLAFACVDVAYAVDIDTTGGYTLSVGGLGETYTGAGTLTVSGDVWLGTADNAPTTYFAMTGGVIDIPEGSTLRNGGWKKANWDANKASLQVNGTFDVNDGQWILADALTGSGTVTMGDVYGWYTQGLILGLNNGGGTFTGTISDLNNGTDIIELRKYGSGTQILTGTNTYSGSTLIGDGTLAVSGALEKSAVTVQTGAAFAAGSTGLVGRATLGKTLTFENGSALLVDVAATEADVVEVTKDVTIGTGVEVRLSGDQTRGGSWMVLSTGGAITGDFVLVGARNGSFLAKRADNTEIWLTIPPPMGTLIRFL
jgi:autotransporter-associated beta strand protein